MGQICAQRKRQRKRIWIVDDDTVLTRALERVLEGEKMDVSIFSSTELAFNAMRIDSPDVLIIEARLEGESGIDLLISVTQRLHAPPVLVISRKTDLRSAISAYKNGAFEYLSKPFEFDRLITLVKGAVIAAEQKSSDQGPSLQSTPQQLIGQARSMQKLFRAVGRLSHSYVPVLITGEPGVGKELLARTLHEHSPFAMGGFMLISSMHADVAQVEAALKDVEGGECVTLFFEEISTLTDGAQALLVQILSQESSLSNFTDGWRRVRIIAASQFDLKIRTTSGHFKRELLQLLTAAHLEVPPLRDRKEDIPELVRYYLRMKAKELGVVEKIPNDEFLGQLSSYHWPGNVRELIAICTRVTIFAPCHEVTIDDIPMEILLNDKPVTSMMWASDLQVWVSHLAQMGNRNLLELVMPEFEGAVIRAALQFTGGHRREAAELLGWGRNTLTSKMKCLGIEEDDSNHETKT